MYKISIITINYNNRQGLLKTICSVRQQSCKDFEFIVVDGASSDGGVEVISKNLDIITNGISEKDDGIYNAMNKGVKMATGKYLIFLNSGDIFANKYVIENLYKQDFDADILQGDSLCVRKGKISHIWEAPKYITCNVFYSGSLSHQSAVIRRELLIETPYDENLSIAADKKFFFEQLIMRNASYKKLHIQVAKFDIEGISNNAKFEQKKLQENRFIIESLPDIWLKDYDEYIGNRTELEKWVYENRKSTFTRILSSWISFISKIKRKLHVN